jgi:hypothetical protein
VGALLTIIGGVTVVVIVVILAWNWLGFVATGRLNREQVSIDLAGQTPLGVSLIPCGGREKPGKVVDGRVSTSFGVCDQASYAILSFKDFDAVCTVPYMDSMFANDATWRFRVVGHKCELISY